MDGQKDKGGASPEASGLELDMSDERRKGEQPPSQTAV